MLKPQIAPELLRGLPTPSSSSVQSLDWISSLANMWATPLAQPLTGYNEHDTFYAKSVLVPESSPLTVSNPFTQSLNSANTHTYMSINPSLTSPLHLPPAPRPPLLLTLPSHKRPPPPRPLVLRTQPPRRPRLPRQHPSIRLRCTHRTCSVVGRATLLSDPRSQFRRRAACDYFR